MTKREFYVAIANGEMNDEVKATAAEYIAKMDEANEKRKNTLSKKQEENEAIKAEILEHLDTEAKTATTVGELMGISTQKATVTEVKITGKGKQKGYTKNFTE